MAKTVRKLAIAEDALAMEAKQTKWPLIIVAMIIVILSIGGGAVWALKKKKFQDDEEGGPAKKQTTKGSGTATAPIFVPMEVFTVKLQADLDGQEQYLQLVPALKALDLPASEKIKAYLPQIRHDMLSVMSVWKPSELSTPQGMDKLSIALRNRINQPLLDSRDRSPGGDRAGPDDPVQAVLFSSLIIQ